MGLQDKKIFASILLVLVSFVGTAQGSGQPPPPMPPPPPGLPIDNWIYALFMVALIFGIFKKIKTSKI